MENLIKKSLFDLIFDAATANVPETQTVVDESWTEEYEQEFLCILPEQLRALSELVSSLCELICALDSEPENQSIDIESGSINTYVLDLLEMRIEAVQSVLYSELAIVCPSITEIDPDDMRLSCLSGWRVVKLTFKQGERIKGRDSHTVH